MAFRFGPRIGDSFRSGNSRIQTGAELDEALRRTQAKRFFSQGLPKRGKLSVALAMVAREGRWKIWVYKWWCRHFAIVMELESTVTKLRNHISRHTIIRKFVTMGFITKSLLAGLVAAVSVSGQCTGPAINSASLSLIAEFEGFRPDVCK